MASWKVKLFSSLLFYEASNRLSSISSIFPSTITSLPVPVKEKHLDVNYTFLPQFKTLKLQKCFLLVWTNQNTLFKIFALSPQCSIAHFKLDLMSCLYPEGLFHQSSASKVILGASLQIFAWSVGGWTFLGRFGVVWYSLMDWAVTFKKFNLF